MKFLFDLFPVLLFFIAYKLGDAHQADALAFVTKYMSALTGDGNVTLAIAPVLLATIVAIAASFLQIGYLLARKKKVDGMLWMSLVIITLFGGATIYFHSDTFIKWKPTILYWCFAVVMFVTQVLMKKNMMRTAMQDQISLPDAVWARLGYAYMAFFFGYGVLNLFVAFVFYANDFGAYATFKAFGQPAIFIVFVVLQTLYLAKYVEETKA
jgi:intracellular septation protein